MQLPDGGNGDVARGLASQPRRQPIMVSVCGLLAGRSDVRSLFGLHRHLVNDLAHTAHLIYRPEDRAALDLVLQGARECQASAANGGSDFRLRSRTQ